MRTSRCNRSTPCPSIKAMRQTAQVTQVKPLAGHKLRLWFDDGAEGEVDLSGRRWRGVFAPLADQAFFERVEVDEELGTIVWPNGADIAPETLHSWVAQGATTAQPSRP